MKLQIWKQAVWQFLLNASFCRCAAAMSDLAHVFLKHLPRGPNTADYLQADPNVLCESFEALLTDLACRLQGGRASKKKLEVSLSEAFGRSMSPAESKCFAERLLAGLEHIYNKRRQATSGAKLQPPVQRIVKAISSSSLETLSPAPIEGPKIDPLSLSPPQIREQYAKQLSALPEVASDDESAPSASPEAGVEAICVESSQILRAPPFLRFLVPALRKSREPKSVQPVLKRSLSARSLLWLKMARRSCQRFLMMRLVKGCRMVVGAAAV